MKRTPHPTGQRLLTSRAGLALQRLAASPILWMALVLLIGVDVDARVGGGQSFSGGGSSGGGGSFSGGSSGGGGSDGTLDLIIFLIWLCIEYPYIGIPLVVIILIVVAVKHFTGPGRSDSWRSGGTPKWTPARTTSIPPASTHKTARDPVDLSPLVVFDTNFSEILLEDFLTGLYTRAHESRGGDAEEGLDLLSPYLSEKARGTLKKRRMRTVKDVTGIVIGSQQLTSFSGAKGPTVSITVEFEANYSERYEGESGAPVGFYVRERWQISRKRGAKSRAPDKLMALGCPNCGAPVEESQDERCQSCEAVFNSGEFDWFVDDIKVFNEEPKGPLLTGHVGERGTNLPTLLAPDLEARFKSLKSRDGAFDLDGMKARVKLVFNTVQDSWTNLNWEAARPFSTDRFWMAQNYWIKAYKDQNLRNILDNMKIQRMEPVKITHDAYFDAITYRIWASGLDYTVREGTRQPISGSNKLPRKFTEYWTFIRSSTAKGPAKADKNCPNCGAPLKINQAGHCEYCAAKVVGGGFDWVLSRIEQDETYRG